MPDPPQVIVRPAAAADIAAIVDIYAHHVRHGLGSFEERPPDDDEMRRRFEAVRDIGLPYLVAAAASEHAASEHNDDGLDKRLLGYCYAAPFRTRSAYRHTVEDSVYVAPHAVGAGVGRTLLGALIDHCTALGRRQMVAVIGDSSNARSITLHRKMGFRHVGILYAVGYKAGRWVDSVIMQRPLGHGEDAPPQD